MPFCKQSVFCGFNLDNFFEYLLLFKRLVTKSFPSLASAVSPSDHMGPVSILCSIRISNAHFFAEIVGPFSNTTWNGWLTCVPSKSRQSPETFILLFISDYFLDVTLLTMVPDKDAQESFGRLKFRSAYTKRLSRWGREECWTRITLELWWGLTRSLNYKRVHESVSFQLPAAAALEPSVYSAQSRLQSFQRSIILTFDTRLGSKSDKMQFSALIPAAVLASFAFAVPTPYAEPNDIVLPPGVTESEPKSLATVGSAVVSNRCNFNVFLRSVGSSVGPEVTIAPGKTYSEQFHLSGSGSGISIKVDKSGDPTGSGAGNIAQFEYTLASNLVYYDLSLINGDPFVANRQAIVPADASCHQVVCNANQQPCPDA